MRRAPTSGSTSRTTRRSSATIENFPTLAVYRDGIPLFFGVSPPQEGVIARTLGAFASPEAKSIEVPAAVAALGASLERGDSG